MDPMEINSLLNIVGDIAAALHGEQIKLGSKIIEAEENILNLKGLTHRMKAKRDNAALDDVDLQQKDIIMSIGNALIPLKTAMSHLQNQWDCMDSFMGHVQDAARLLEKFGNKLPVIPKR